MPAGESFSSGQRHEVDRAIRYAETLCRLEFSVFVGRSEGETRAFAERLHGTLLTPDRSVLILVDPVARLLEVVSGPVARGLLDEQQVRLAAMTMKSAFAGGDLVGGITRGVRQLAEQARRPEVLHGQQTREP